MPANVFHTTGPPGCGKTTALSRWATAAAEKHGRAGVMICSLTKAAAAEVKGRGLDLEPENVGTLHSVCFRALGRPAIAEAKIKEWNEEHPAYQITSGYSSLDEAPEDRTGLTMGDELYAELNMLRARMTPEELWPTSVKAFAAKWRDWLKQCDYIDFTGLIERCLADIYCAPGAPSVILGDEAQDWSKLETALLRDKWGQHAETVVLCGDPDQAIYSWRGADARIFLDHPVPESNKRLLSQSYRVPRAVHAHALRWIGRIRDREQVVYRPRDEDGSVAEADATWRYPDPLLPLIEQHVAEGHTLMILASCSYLLAPTLAMLRREGIPFANPYRRNNGAWNPLGHRKGKTSVDRLLAFLANSFEHSGDEARFWTPDELVSWLSHMRSPEPLVRGAKKALETLTATPNMETWRAWFASQDHADRAAFADLDWFEESLIPSKAKGYEFPLKVLRARGKDALTAEPTVFVGTIHSVKGGEADTVVIYPDLSRAGMMEWIGGNPDAVTRLFYVGMTRARSDLVLCRPATSNALRELLA